MEINNRDIRLKDVLKRVINAGSRLDVAAATFSMHAFADLKDELMQIDEMRFIFNSPTFTNSEVSKQEAREFTIPKINREKTVIGSSHELKLLNELQQKAIAKECADWIRQKVKFKSITINEEIGDGFKIKNNDVNYAIDSFKNFDRRELGVEPTRFPRTRNIYGAKANETLNYLTEFENYWHDDEHFKDVTNEILESLNVAYKENSPEFIYYVTLYNLFKDFLEDLNADHQPNELVGFKNTKIWNMLFSFQKDAVTSIITKLEKFNGCILADSVGLGKTFTALAVITYYLKRNKDVLVLCPKKLENNWNQYRHNYKTNPFASDRLNYDVLFHTDLSREQGHSNSIDLSQIHWENYDLIVIDESHAFRNGGSSDREIEEGRENRYSKLLNQVLRPGKQTKVLMLSATPVNNRFNDLKHQLELAYEGKAENINDKLDTDSGIDEIFRGAQRAYNEWEAQEPEERTTADLLDRLSFDFFKVLDSVTIARSRKHIEEFYDISEVGKFPTRLKPKNFAPDLTVTDLGINYSSIYERLNQLNLAIYQPSIFIHPSKLHKYENNAGEHNFSLMNRQLGTKRLMMINLLKRLESSVYSFRHTLVDVLKAYVDNTIASISQFENNIGDGQLQAAEFEVDHFDFDDSNNDLFNVGKKVKIDLNDMDYQAWKQYLTEDQLILSKLATEIEKIIPAEDAKLQKLFRVIDSKMHDPINEGNKKIIIFSAFATTTEYLYEHVSKYMTNRYQLESAMISGTTGIKNTLNLKGQNLNEVLTYFSPNSKNKSVIYPDDNCEIDILIATDVISEGQNLQDADTMINFDIHWNPVRIVQRFGRVDRIGSKNDYIQMVNFWPNIDLDEYINLKSRVEARMKISVLTSTADDNILTDEQIAENDYRKKQLTALQSENIDLEDVDNGISIMDLGLEEYRMDLLNYLKDNPKLEKAPFGLQTVIQATAENPTGVIFVLKNINAEKGMKQKNKLHPFYIVYVSQFGEIIVDANNSQQTLGKLKKLCKNKSEPLVNIYSKFNSDTRDGKNMEHYSKLLQDAISSIVKSENKNTVDALFGTTNVDLTAGTFEGMDDFELVCFYAVTGGDN